MITIEQLINKIKWDENEDPADYSLFYLDRVSNKLVEIKYEDILRVNEGFIVLEREGDETQIPLHRIRRVVKKEETVWER